MSNNRELYRIEGMPIFQNRMYPSAESARACVTGDVVLVQNMDTGLVYNEAFDPSLVVYDRDYQNEQANSSAFQEHLDDVAGLIHEHLAGKSLIEVGCGKGGFLEKLACMGFEITGMDPAYEGDNESIRREYFTPESDTSADGVILRHVLEHIPDPVSFLEGIRESNGGGGLVYIEVPCLDWILENHSWFDVFYEHVNYFRLSDFERMFGKVVSATNRFGGQYLSVLADLSTLRTPARTDEPITFPENFTGGALRHSELLKANAGKPTAVWGGASKGVVFAIHMERLGTPVKTIVDINPAKQGKHVAVTGLQIVSAQEAINKLPEDADVIVMNPNYLAEICELTNNRYQYRTTDLT